MVDNIKQNEKKNEKPALREVRGRGAGKEKALLVFHPNKLLTAILYRYLCYCFTLISGNEE